tara:strand:+ start:599 stop:814 length:216 start_codon:yes stop_codon:yes gene_type:complete
VRLDVRFGPKAIITIMKPQRPKWGRQLSGSNAPEAEIWGIAKLSIPRRRKKLANKYRLDPHFPGNPLTSLF